MENLTPEQLEAILGTDYETIIADVLRQKGNAEERAASPGQPVGQVGDGQVIFDPGTIISNLVNQRMAMKQGQRADKRLNDILGQQKAGRKTAAYAMSGQQEPPPPPVAPDGAEVLPDVQTRQSFLQRLKSNLL